MTGQTPEREPPVLTVVIPAYEDVGSIREHIEYFRKHPTPGLALVILDDSRSSAIADLLDELRNGLEEIDVRYHHNASNLGAVHNWNKGLSIASTDYVHLLHHDEFITHDRFYCDIVDLIRRDRPDAIFVKHDGNFGKSLANILDRFFVAICRSIVPFFNPFGSPSVLITRSRERYDSELNWFVDVEYFHRVLVSASRVEVLRHLHVETRQLATASITTTLNKRIMEIRRTEKRYIRAKYGMSALAYAGTAASGYLCRVLIRASKLA